MITKNLLIFDMKQTYRHICLLSPDVAISKHYIIRIKTTYTLIPLGKKGFCKHCF